MNAPVPDPALSAPTLTLGDAIRMWAKSPPGNAATLALDALANQADELESHLALARNNARLGLDQRNEARAQVATAAADAVEGAWKLLDCDHCSERLAKLVDQWRAEANGATQ